MRSFVNICLIKTHDKIRAWGGDCGKSANLLGGNILLSLIDCILLAFIFPEYNMVCFSVRNYAFIL